MALPSFAPSFMHWPRIWEFADADQTADRLAAAGFSDIDRQPRAGARRVL
jgi:hypothetical protein